MTLKFFHLYSVSDLLVRVQRDLKLEAVVVAKYAAVAPVLDERSRRVWAAAESLAIGYGGTPEPAVASRLPGCPRGAGRSAHAR